MKKCIVFPLKEEINALSFKIGSFAYETDSVRLQFADGNSYLVRIIDGGTFEGGATEKVCGNYELNNLSEVSKVIVDDVNYKLQKIALTDNSSLDLSIFKGRYNENMEDYIPTTVRTIITGDLANLNGCKFANLLLSFQDKITGNISNVSAWNKLLLRNCTNIQGSISTLQPSGTINLWGATQITGSIESMIQFWRNEYPTLASGGSIAFISLGNEITFNGEIVVSEIGGNDTLIWTASTITYHGITVNA